MSDETSPLLSFTYQLYAHLLDDRREVMNRVFYSSPKDPPFFYALGHFEDLKISPP